MTLGQHRRFFAPAGMVVLCAVAADYESRAASPDSGQIVMKNYMFAHHHTRVVLTIIEQLRNRSIALRTHGLDAPNLGDPKNIAARAQHYAALCIDCHLAPGVTKSEIRAGLYPHPPNLAEEDVDDAQRAFWIIKHGIKMSAMPAWGKTFNDAAIWEIVAFVRQMPMITAESYQQLTTQ